MAEYFIDSEPPVPSSSSPKKPTVRTSFDDVDVKREYVPHPPPVLVEEPEEVTSESAVDDDDLDDYPRSADSSALPASTALVVPRTSASPDGGGTPTESISDISIETNDSAHSDDSRSQRERRSSSVTQFLQRSTSFSKHVTRHLSLGRKKDQPATDRSASLPADPDSHPANGRPPMSRSNSLRVARELQREREVSALALNVPDSNADGTKSAPPTGTGAPSLDSEDPEIRERLLRETEEELHRVREEKKRERAALKSREAEEKLRTMREGRWTRRVLRKGAIYHAG